MLITWYHPTTAPIPVHQTTLHGFDAWGHEEHHRIEWRGLRVGDHVVWLDECPVSLRQGRSGRLILSTIPVQVADVTTTVVEADRVEDRQVWSEEWPDNRDEVGPELGQGEWRVVAPIGGMGHGRPADIAEAAERVGVSVSTLRAYRRDGTSGFPEPDGVIGGAHWWWQSTIDAWQAQRPGKGGRPLKS